MNIHEAKEYILTLDPKEIALTARRGISGLRFPVCWEEHREGGGVVIDSAEFDFANLWDEEIIKFAVFFKLSGELQERYKGYSLTEFLAVFD